MGNTFNFIEIHQKEKKKHKNASHIKR